MKELIYFDSRNPHCKSPFGSVEQDREMTFKIFVKDGVYVSDVELHIYEDGADIPYVFRMSFNCKRGDESEYIVKVNINKVGLYWYRFLLRLRMESINIAERATTFNSRSMTRDTSRPIG